MRVTLAVVAVAAAVLLGACAGKPAPATNCTMTMTGTGADAGLRCVYFASPDMAPFYSGATGTVWGLDVLGYRDEAQQDLAVLVDFQFPGPVVETTYAIDASSDPAAPPAARVLRSAGSLSAHSPLTHVMASPYPSGSGTGAMTATFTSVTCPGCSGAQSPDPNPPPPPPTHGTLDATLVATDGSGGTLDLHVDF